MLSVVAMSDARIALVTGANQGLGFALTAGLAVRMNPEDLVLLTGRNARRVTDAAAAVTSRAGTRSRVLGRVLDVADAGSPSRPTNSSTSLTQAPMRSCVPSAPCCGPAAG